MAHLRRHPRNVSELRRPSDAVDRLRWPAPDPATRMLPDFGSMELWFEPASPAAATRPVDVTTLDLPALTAKVGMALTRLRAEFGVVYRSRTWIDEVLPIFGGRVKDATLTRDVLAIAALDAGGVRADVSGLAGFHERDEIIAAARELLAALERLLADCEASTDRRPIRQPDPPTWPAWLAGA